MLRTDYLFIIYYKSIWEKQEYKTMVSDYKQQLCFRWNSHCYLDSLDTIFH